MNDVIKIGFVFFVLVVVMQVLWDLWYSRRRGHGRGQRAEGQEERLRVRECGRAGCRVCAPRRAELAVLEPADLLD